MIIDIFPFVVSILLSPIIIYLIFLRFLSKKINTEKELIQKTKYWQTKLGMINVRVHPSIDSKLSRPDSDVITPRKEYKFRLTPKYSGNTEYVILHELLHIKRGHFERYNNVSKILRLPLNIILDIVVDAQVILIWIKLKFLEQNE